MAKDENRIGRVFFPNVITPNGDDKNENFIIEGLEKYAHNKLVIFNRYGDHVYEVEDYKNNWNAKGLNSGTYYYVLVTTDAHGLQTTFKGWVQVIKDNRQ